jgi:hypothetical protein
MSWSYDATGLLVKRIRGMTMSSRDKKSGLPRIVFLHEMVREIRRNFGFRTDAVWQLKRDIRMRRHYRRVGTWMQLP